MLYAILCYDFEDVVGAWTREEDDAAMARLAVVQEKLDRGRAGSALSPACCPRPPRRLSGRAMNHW